MSARREVLWGDLDILSADRLLWWPHAKSEDADAGRVRRAVQTCLTEKQREVIEAYYFEGCSQSEIARRLGVTQQVVHKRIFGVRRNGRWVGGALRRLARHLGS
ncbi:MAG: sigma factor-like helix-turn-helix DNA-binding protein [Myxococcota bacterium]